MHKFKLETSLQFPFFKMKEIVSYSEVRKPSGIAYMLLVLINESKDKKALLSQVLENFGVTNTLHYIYADVIADLIRKEILTMVNGKEFNVKFFSSYRISDIAFTAKGKEIFKDESIPTGVIKEAKIPIYYNIALKQLLLEIPTSFDPRPWMEESAISDEFISQFSCEKNVEDFININKGVRIPIYKDGKVVKYELIKKEEVITKVDEIKIENWIGKYDCTLILEGNSVKFEFEDKAIQKFFDSNYNSQIVNSIISYKNKFQFSSSHSFNLDLTSFTNKEIVGIIIPKEINDVLKQKGQLLITKGNYESKNYYSVKIESGIQKYDSACEFIVVDNADNKFAFIPGVFKFNNPLGTIEIPLVLKTRVSTNELKEVLASYVSLLGRYSEQNFNDLVNVTNVSKDYDKAFEIMSGYLTNNYESNIILLNEMKNTALKNVNILKQYKQLLSDNYNAYLKTVSEDNLETVLKITNTIPKFLDIPQENALGEIFENLTTIKNKQKVFEILVNKGFNKTIVILYVNPVADVLKQKEAAEKSLLDLLNYDDCIKKMQKIIGISDYKKYSFDEELVNRIEFKKAFVTAKKLQNDVDFFKSQNKDLFAQYDGFMALFETINDDFNILDAALSNPKNIKPELIEKKITSGDYQFVFVNLSAKLEIILKNTYKLNGKLSEMISDARKKDIISKSIESDLHTFRENRNVYTHAEERSFNFKPDDLRRWSKQIFELENKKDE
ncbi:MAG: hypothetical protein HUJ42_00845 [Malacoplasma sp.]|nr:hypothetical protein [Malacoplasma sp.]